MSLRRDAFDGYGLRAQRFFECCDNNRLIARLKTASLNGAVRFLHLLQSFLRWIDRAGNHARPFAGRGKRTQRDDQVFELQRRSSGIQSDHPAGQVGKESFSRAGDHDVFGFRIVKDVRDACQARQILHVVRQR